jgi:hypothetical protein
MKGWSTIQRRLFCGDPAAQTGFGKAKIFSTDPARKWEVSHGDIATGN